MLEYPCTFAVEETRNLHIAFRRLSKPSSHLLFVWQIRKITRPNPKIITTSPMQNNCAQPRTIGFVLSLKVDWNVLFPSSPSLWMARRWSDQIWRRSCRSHPFRPWLGQSMHDDGRNTLRCRREGAELCSYLLGRYYGCPGLQQGMLNIISLFWWLSDQSSSDVWVVRSMHSHVLLSVCAFDISKFGIFLSLRIQQQAYHDRSGYW